MRRGLRVLSGASISREEGVRRAILEKLKPLSLHVQDDGGGCEGGTLRVTVTSEAFRGKTVVAQHRMVNEAIGDYMKSFHAVVLKTSTPTKQ